jgi:hypothetical protein
MADPPTFEMRPARRGSIFSRFAALCISLTFLLVCASFFRSLGPGPDAVSFSLMWLVLAFFVGLLLALVAAIRWLFLGPR